MSATWERFGLYIHVPYCIQRCSYCDFFTMPLSAADNRESAFSQYLTALHQEILAQLPAFQDRTLSSIFLGGGTPSLLTPDELDSVLSLVRELLPFEGIEVTLEVNPETVDVEKAKQFREVGINRVSMGVQSLDAASLNMLGRGHTAETARTCYDALRDAGMDNVNLDMIYGRPGQTVAAWEEELRALLAWEPEHLSLYELILEPGTPMTRAVRAGELVLPEEDERLAMYQLCRDLTSDMGLDWYEVANFARPGREAQHNLDNWRGAEYLGVGPGAHSFRASPGWGARRANPRNMPMYLGAPAAAPWKERTREQVIQETLMNGLRLREGLDLRGCLARYGIDLAIACEGKLDALVEAVYLEQSDSHWRLTSRGTELLDSVVAHLSA